MAGYRISDFRGIRPRRSALKLPEGEAQTATNTKLGSGDIQPWVAPSDGTAVQDPFFNKTNYLYEDSTINPKWLQWSAYVSVAPGTVKGDSLNRVYYTGDGAPKMTYDPIATNGSQPYPSAYRLLGIPAPTVAPTATGTPLPETVDSALRRTLPGSMTTKLFEIVFVDYSVYPGTGTPDTLWNLNAAATGDITFAMGEGDSFRVTEVVDEDTVRLGSSSSTGAFAATEQNDKTAIQYWNPMDNNGSTREADWTGWRIPDGLQVTIIGHLLRVGDVIRVTTSDFSNGIIFPYTVAQNFYQQNWATAVQVTIGGATFWQTPNGKVAASADATTSFPALNGGFYYDVDRSSSTAEFFEDRSYVYTYVSSLGEEGPPSPVSATVNALDGDTIVLSGLEAPPSTFYDITHINIYRTNATAAGTEFQFVRQVAVSDTATDNVKGQNLGEILGTATWEAPPTGMQGITSMPNGMLVGFEGKNLHFCEPYFPHAWPPEYDQAIDYEIVGLAAVGNSVVAVTEGVPYILTGSHPRNVNIRPYEINQACTSARSIASTKDKVVYASPDGLVEIGANGASIVTEQYVDKSDWASFDPTTIVGEIHDGKYFGFYGAVGAVSQPPVTVFLSGTVTAAGSLPLETDIVAGNETIILTLASDTWVAAGATFDGQRQNIINGIVSSSSFYTGWNQAILPNIPVGDVVRTNDTVVTITLTARPEYSITAAETITVTVPASALVTTEVPVDADVPFIISPLEDYSTTAIVFTDFESGLSDAPFAINSSLDILDWDSYEGVGTDYEDKLDITAAAYSASLNRWLAVGERDATASTLPSRPVFVTSLDNGINWTQRAHQLLSVTTAAPRTAVRFDDYSVFVVAGDNKSMQVSVNGENWSLASISATIPANASINSLVIADTSTSPYIYAGCDNVNYLIRSPDLDLFPATNTWNASTVTYASATGTKLMASGAGKVLSIGNFDTDMEIAETAHGALTGASIGAISAFNCTGFVIGDDLWVGVSNDFRIVTCANGLEATIGNWTAPTVTKAANVTIHGLMFDEGDTIVQGYGFIAYGVNTSTSKGVVYTSPDAVTWTLRHTQTESVPIKAGAVKYPESQLASVLADFAPTYNGAQAPTQIGNSTASYEYLGFKGAADGTVQTKLTAYVTPADVTMKIVGETSGSPLPAAASNMQAETTIFTLNTTADEVRISVVSVDTGNSDVGFEGVAAQISSFTPGVFFTPVPYFDVGYSAYAQALAIGLPGEGLELNISESIITIAFTYRKAGYNDLTVTYKVRGYVTVNAQSTA